MANKIALLLTLSALQALELPALQSAFKEALNADPDPALDKEELLNELLKQTTPATEPKAPKGSTSAKSKKKVAEDAIEFEHKGIKYRVNDKSYPKVFIPNIGERTAAEIAFDKKAQAYLVDQDCIGTVIDIVEG